MRVHFIAIILAVGVILGYGFAGAESKQWNESRQFEQYLEKADPELMRYIYATHISKDGLEVQVAMGMYHRTYLGEQGFYKKVSEYWKSSEFVRDKKYPGKVQFMQFDKPLKIVH